MADLASDVGGVAALSRSDRILLGRAVDLLLRKAGTHNDHVRAVNTAMRVVEAIRRRVPKPEPPGPSLADYLVSKTAKAEAVVVPSLAQVLERHHR